MTQTLEIFQNGINKEDIPHVVNAMVDGVLEKGNPLEVAESIKVMEEIISGVKGDKRYKDYALDEIAKYGKAGYMSPRGVKIELFEAGGRYSFDNCNDPVIKELEAKLKERQEFLKKLPSEGITLADEETGEIRTIWPAQKQPGVSTYKITLKK